MLNSITVLLVGFFAGYIFKAFYPISYIQLTSVELLNIMGTWLSAIGTLFAVGFAVYYSEKAHRLQTPSVELSATYDNKAGSHLFISITNTSYAPLKSQGLRIHKNKIPIFFLDTEYQAKSLNPKRLEDLDEFGSNITLFFDPNEMIKSSFIDILLNQKASDLKITYVSTTAVFSTPFPPSLLAKLKELSSKP